MDCLLMDVYPYQSLAADHPLVHLYQFLEHSHLGVLHPYVVADIALGLSSNSEIFIVQILLSVVPTYTKHHVAESCILHTVRYYSARYIPSLCFHNGTTISQTSDISLVHHHFQLAITSSCTPFSRIVCELSSIRSLAADCPILSVFKLSSLSLFHLYFVVR